MRSRYTTLFRVPFALPSLAGQIAVGSIITQPQMIELAQPGQIVPVWRIGAAFLVRAGFAHAGRIGMTVSAENPGAVMPTTDHGSVADLPPNGMGSNGGGGVQ
jgi:hypothetical protein